MREVFGDEDHVGAVLAGADDPIHLFRGGIVAANDLVDFRGEVKLAAGKIQPVRPAQRGKIDLRQRLLRHEVHNGNRVEGAKALIRDVCPSPVSRRGHFMRVLTGRNGGHDFECGRIHDLECMVLLGKHQQGG